MSSAEAKRLYERLKKEAEGSGYYLNPDVDFVLDLMEGLLVNEKRYGYWACPCRLADGVREKDLDIICPCDYRDPDLADHGACFCALYVTEEVFQGARQWKSIPDRRIEDQAAQAASPTPGPSSANRLSAREDLPVWRCKVCGYLCARTDPPLKCPICKADQDRFARF